MLWLGAIALCALIGFDALVMIRSRSAEPAAPAGSVAAAKLAPVAPPPVASALAAPQAALPGAVDAGADAAGPEEMGESEEGTPEPAPKKFKTVGEAAVGSCSTVSVSGLSRQIVEASLCMNPRAFAALPARANLRMGPHVLPYLERTARDRLVQVLDKHKAEPMTVNSALRTLPQQYLVWRWAAGKRCGVRVATPPGDSNHEAGLALDIAEDRKWRPALEAAEFRWLGASDRVHFDFRRRERPPGTRLDVQAFQKLWNLNHPKDRITESGKYDAATETRLKRAPPDGFKVAPRCSKL
jgi:hypothetical protein